MNKEEFLKDTARTLCEFEKFGYKIECEDCKIREMCSLYSTADKLYEAGFRKVEPKYLTEEPAGCLRVPVLTEEQKRLANAYEDGIKEGRKDYKLVVLQNKRLIEENQKLKEIIYKQNKINFFVGGKNNADNDKV